MSLLRILSRRSNVAPRTERPSTTMILDEDAASFTTPPPSYVSRLTSRPNSILSDQIDQNSDRYSMRSSETTRPAERSSRADTNTTAIRCLPSTASPDSTTKTKPIKLLSEDHCVYYQIFGPTGAYRPRNLVQPLPANPSGLTGGLPAAAIPPPQTASSIVQTIANSEYLSGLAELYEDVACRLPMAKDRFVQLFKDDQTPAGTTPFRPLILVFSEMTVMTQPDARNIPGNYTINVVPPLLYPDPKKCVRNKSFVHFRIFTPSGAYEVNPRSSNDSFLGKLLVMEIPPPHTVSSLKQSISNHVFLSGPTELYLNIKSAKPMKNDEYLQLLESGDKGLGGKLEHPVVLIFTEVPTTREQPTEDGETLNPYQPTTQSFSEKEKRSCTKKMRVTSYHTSGNQVVFQKDDIIWTQGKTQRNPPGIYGDAYKALNMTGDEGYIPKEKVVFVTNK